MNLPAYDAGIGEAPPTTYGTLACADSVSSLGLYPHLIIENPDGLVSADDRVIMHTDFGCNVDEGAGDIDPARIDVQPKLCKPTAVGCDGSTCTTADCGPWPECCPATSYPRCCALVRPTNPNGFACSVGQDFGNQLTAGIAQSGLVSCEMNESGIHSEIPLPIPLPIEMSSLLEVESFARLIPPIDDYADPGSHVTIRWRPYGDGNPATTEICAAIGGPPGPVYQAQGCSALINTGPVDINFSFRNIYTDLFIEQGGQLKRALGIKGDIGGAMDLEFGNIGPPQNYSSKAAFLSSGCNPLAVGSDCIKLAIDPLDFMNQTFRYQELEPDYVLANADLADSFPATLMNFVGGAIQFWLETQFTLSGLGFDMLFAGPDAGGWPDLDGNGAADYLTCSGNFAGTLDIEDLLDLLSGTGGGGTVDPCAIENLKSLARKPARKKAAERRAAASALCPDTSHELGIRGEDAPFNAITQNNHPRADAPCRIPFSVPSSAGASDRAGDRGACGCPAAPL